MSRCWAYETSALLDVEISDDIPKNDFWDFYAPDHKLHIAVRTRSAVWGVWQ